MTDPLKLTFFYNSICVLEGCGAPQPQRLVLSDSVHRQYPRLCRRQTLPPSSSFLPDKTHGTGDRRSFETTFLPRKTRNRAATNENYPPRSARNSRRFYSSETHFYCFFARKAIKLRVLLLFHEKVYFK